MASRIMADTDFNRDDDKTKFGCQYRIVDISCLGDLITLSFDLGHKEDACMYLMFETDELMRRLSEAIRTKEE